VNNDSIIYNELPLTEAFIPTRLLHREGQLKELERCLKPAGKKAEDKNLRKVTIEEVKQATKEAKRFKTSYFSLREYSMMMLKE